jgi:hypothetical protein
MWPGITATRDFYIDAAHFLMGPGRSVAQMKPMTISKEMKLQKPIEPLDVVNQHWVFIFSRVVMMYSLLGLPNLIL